MSFDRLEAIIKARTPGPWHQQGNTFYLRECSKERPGKENFEYFVMPGNCETARFIATVGTLADLLLDVVKAASDFEAASHDYPEQTNFWVSDQKAFLHGQYALADALSALRAAQDKLP